MSFQRRCFFFLNKISKKGLKTDATKLFSDGAVFGCLDHRREVPIVCSTVCSGADQRNQQSSASLAFERGIRR